MACQGFRTGAVHARPFAFAFYVPFDALYPHLECLGELAAGAGLWRLLLTAAKKAKQRA